MCYCGVVMQIDRTYDKSEDADLWKDGLFGRRTMRYLCVERSIPDMVSKTNKITVSLLFKFLWNHFFFNRGNYHALVLLLPNEWQYELQMKSFQFQFALATGLLRVRKIHMCSTLPLSSLAKVALEPVPVLVGLVESLAFWQVLFQCPVAESPNRIA